MGRQNISFRGHHDDSQYHPPVGEYYMSGNVGSFVELLNYKIRNCCADDCRLRNHLTTCPKNATYISKTTQNEFIQICGTQIQYKKEIRVSTFFCIIADEAKDNSGKEQLSLVVRFIDINLQIREEFIEFIHCDEGLSGLEMAQYNLSALEKLNIDISKCRGQTYDGAGSMSGYKSGC